MEIYLLIMGLLVVLSMANPIIKKEEINKLLFIMSKSSFNGFNNRRNAYRVKNMLSGYRAFLIQVYNHIEDQNIKNKNKSKI